MTTAAEQIESLIMLPTVNLPDQFGPALRLLRKRAQLTQDELGRAVGYSREQIARLENGSRLPDLAVIAALFVPALRLERERALVAQLLALAGESRHRPQITVTHTTETRLQIVQERVATPGHVPPAPLLPLLGRQGELAQLVARLATARLLTLVGAPGIGKSRLALEVAHGALAQFADGAAFVSLAEIRLPEDIPLAIVRQLGITPQPQQSAAAAVAAYLAPRQLLLVLDNCEHLLDGVACFSDWLAQAPRLTLLCTSRVPLDLYGEQEWPLAPLALPDLAQPPTLAWGDYPALQLLLARAQAIDPDFTLTDDNVLPLATLCVALDGLPLALELAAVRLRDHAPAALVQQLLALRGVQQLSSTWLQQTRRNVAERHRTLQAAIGWSVHLLPPETQRAFAALGVFVGGGTPAAAGAVAAADGALLAQLARANLITLTAERFQLLETLRAYALEQLAALDLATAAHRAHADYYRTFAQAVFDGLQGEAQAFWMQQALAEQDNCVEALRWALATGDGDTAVALAGGLWWFWYRRGLFAPAREWLAAALRLPSHDMAQRANAYNGLASFYLVEEEYAANLACHEQGLALRRQLGDAAGIATVLHNMGLTAYTMGDYALATARLQESIAVYPQGNNASALAHLGLIAQETNDLPQARHYLTQACASAPAGWTQAFVRNYLADVLRELGDLTAAADLATESLHLFTALDDRYYLPDVQLTLAQIALAQGALETAATLAALAHAQYAARDDALFTATARLVQADVALGQGDRAAAATLFAEARALRQRVTRAASPHERNQYATLAQRIHAATPA